MNRGLDTIFFREYRDGKWENVCYTDLTPQGAERVLVNRSDEWLKSLYEHLSNVLQDIQRIVESDINYNSVAISKTITEIETYNSWMIKILMIRGLIRYLGNEYDLICGEPEDE